MAEQTSDEVHEPAEEVEPDTEPATEEVEEPTEPVEEDADEGTEGGSPNREAAKYRRRLREVESERDDLVARHGALQRQVVEGMVSRLGDPKDLWVGGVDLAEVVAEDGSVDPALVRAAVDRVVDAHPSWEVREPFDLRTPYDGVGGSGTGWSDLLRYGTTDTP